MKKKKINVFLDLEEVIIDDWNTLQFLNDKIDFVKKHIEIFKEIYGEKISFHIFSFAITSDRDFDTFNSILSEDIEILFGPIESIFIASNENLIKLADSKGIVACLSDFPSDLFGNMKSESFEEFMKLNYKNQINILFDDTVENSEKTIFHKSFNDYENSTKIITVKV